MLNTTEMKQGEKGRVVKIDGGLGLLRKLESLGIRNGVEIKKTSAQIMRGPITIQVGNTQVAIGYGMARRIFVKIPKPE